MSKLPLILVLAGIALLGYWGYDYSQNNQSAGIGGLEVEVSTATSIFPAVLGGASLLAGLVMMFKGKG